MAETVQLVFEVRKETVDSAAKSLNDLKNKANAVSKSLEKLKSASGMKAIADLNDKINKQSEQLSKLNVELSKTKTKLTNVKSSLKDQVNSLKKSEKSTQDQVKVLKAYNNAQGQVNKTHNVAIAAMGKAVKAAESYEETIKKLKAEIAKLKGEQEKGINGIQKMDATIRDANNSINKQNGLLARLSSSHKAQNQLRIEGAAILREYDKQLKAIELQLKGVISEEQRATLVSQRDKIVTEQQIVTEKQHLAILAMKRANMQALTGVMNKFSATVRTVGMTMSRYLTTAMSAAIAMGVKMAANIEAQIVRFGVLTGQMEKGARLYRQIVEFSAKTPFLLPDLDKAAQTLLAFGSPLENVMDELQRLGDLAMGDADKLDRITMSFGKVRSRGTAHMRELNRFIMSGVPIFQELNKNIGVTGEELFKMVEKNQITFEHVEQAVQSLTNEQGRFHNMLLKVSVTLEGRFSTALDNLRLNLASLFDPFVEGIKDVLVKFIDWSQGFRALSEGARKEIATLMIVLASIGPALIALAGAVKIVTWAFTAFNFVIDPLGATLRTIVALIAVITGSIVFNKLEESLNDAGESAKKLAEYTEMLNNMQEYNKNHVIPGLSEELFNVAKKYDLVTEAVTRLLQANEIREKLDKGFEADTKAVREAKRRYSEIINMAGDAYISLMKQSMPEQFGMLMNLQSYDTQQDYLEKQESARKQIVENLNRQVAEIKADMPFAEKIIDEFFSKDISDLTVDELYSLDFSKLKKSLDVAVKEQFPFTSKEEFMSDAAAQWAANLLNQALDLESVTGLLKQEGITPENFRSNFYKLLLDTTSGIDDAFSDLDDGLSSTSVTINKFKNQQVAIRRALNDYINMLYESVPNLAYSSSYVDIERQATEATKDANNAIDALDENIRMLLRTRISEIKSEAEGENLLRAMLGLTDEKDTINVLEKEIDGLISLLQETAQLSYTELLEMDRSDLPDLVNDIVTEIDNLKIKLEQATRHKERLSLFKAFFEDDIKNVEITKIENQLNEAYDKLASALDGKTIEEIFTAMSTGTLKAMIASTDETTQKVYEQAVLLYDRLQDLTEKAANQRSLLEAFIGGPETFEEFKRNLQIENYYTLLEQEINKELARMQSLKEKYPEVAAGINQLRFNKGTDNEYVLTKFYTDAKELLEAIDAGDYKSSAIEDLIADIKELSIVIESTKDISILESFMTDEDAFRLKERMNTALINATEELSTLLKSTQFNTIADLLMGKEELSAVNKIKLKRILDSVSEFFIEEVEKEDYTGWMKAFVAGPEDFKKFVQEMQVEEWYKSLYEKLESEATARKMSISDLLELGEFNDAEIKRLIESIRGTFEEEINKEDYTSLIQAFIGGEDEFAEYIRKLNLDKAIAAFDEELQKHVTDNRSAIDILSILLGGEIPEDLKPLQPLLDIINEFRDEVEKLTPMETFLNGMSRTLENSVIPAFEKLGESIAKGATGMETMKSAIGSIGQAIMDALPELLFKAGVSIISEDPKNWVVGAGLIAASGIVAGLNGYLGASASESKITESPANTISYSAKGDVFGNGYIARGPIGRSTNYGVSVIGEAGDEAVMPLTRGSGGKLGVAGMGGDVYVTVNNNTSSQVETRETTNSDGSKSIEFLVYDTVKKGLASGEFDRPMANSYGIARRGRY